MPRRARVFQTALCYHVMNRGINGQTIFDDEDDCGTFSRLVCEYKALCAAAVYHWAWMGTHYHMLVEVVYENLRMSGVDDELMREQMNRPILGSEAFAGRLRTQHGRYRRVRGRPAKVCQYPLKTLMDN